MNLQQTLQILLSRPPKRPDIQRRRKTINGPQSSISYFLSKSGNLSLQIISNMRRAWNLKQNTKFIRFTYKQMQNILTGTFAIKESESNNENISRAISGTDKLSVSFWALVIQVLLRRNCL